MAPPGRPSSRDKIVAAAVELSKEVGPGHVSLDAVAQRAGVSKGGLLYNFPSKQKLLEAIVAHHILEFETAFQKNIENNAGKTDSVISACVELFEKKHKGKMPPPASGFLAAMVENPDLMQPARSFSRRLVDMIRANASNEAAALVVFLAIEGLRCLPMLDLDVLTKDERDLVVRELHNMVSRG
ncbi:MAG: TetR/AcrR family transcriptional regulator [Mesorhizobium sp.]|nr:TetR/AcrR family transcriptional regulator [Mesorhizobium sp.]MBL8577299.1 TetR/AcrR family transcriptional regulator [Mesorhizobium sp.]